MFQIGDRVIAVKPVDDYKLLQGRVGTVVHIHEFSGTPIGVEFDEPFEGGHNCKEHGEYGYCRYGRLGDFEYLNEEELVVCDEDKSNLDNFLSDFNICNIGDNV